MSSPDPLFPDPLVTVIIATYNRGDHILPTIASVLQQSFDNFECLVIGDGCTDNTGEIVTGIGDPRLRWINLTQRWGTQSGPNNHGIEMARGRFIAYLGHDDLWEADHLANHVRIYATRAPDAVTSGIILHQGRRGGVDRVLGMFSDETAQDIAKTHFFPPSTLSHTRAIAHQCPPWPPKQSTDVPVDSAFEQALVAQGARVLSTQQVSVHKFVSATRYLSYVVPSSDEQNGMLARMGQQDHAAWLDERLQSARDNDRFMDGRHTTDLTKGAAAKRWSDHTRGLVLPPLQQLGPKPIRITQTPEPRGFDWRPLVATHNGFRWTGPSNQPKILIPVAGQGRADILIQLACTPELSPDQMSWFLNGAPVAAIATALPVADDTGATHTVTLCGALYRDAYSVISLHHPANVLRQRGAGPMVGVGVGEIQISQSTKSDA